MSVRDLYSQLFGKGGIKDGNVIDFAEHGRAGGVSTGQPFKFTSTIPLTSRIEKVGDIKYVGLAKVGSAESASVWQLIKIEKIADLKKITFANGDENFSNIWDNRASYTYS